MAERIVSCIPAHRAYVEPCCGAAWVFWVKPREWSASEILNDTDGDLINFYYQLHRHGRRLAAEVGAMPHGRALFLRMRGSHPTSRFGRAVRFWYLNRVTFGALRCRKPSFGVKCQGRGYVLPVKTLTDLDRTIERLRGVIFESLDMEHLIRLYDRPTTFFYVDPPYVDVKGLYACEFSDEDHQRLAGALLRAKGTWLLSYNNHANVRRLYRGKHLRQITARYTGCSPQACKTVRELLISNRPLRRVKVEYGRGCLSRPEIVN